MRVASVTLDYADATGGSAGSVRQFATALGALTISFTSRELWQEAIRGGSVLQVPLAAGGLGKQYGLPESGAQREAEDALSSVDFIFCHKLFRFHNQWVRRTAARLGIPYCIVPHGSLDPYVFTYRRIRKAFWMRTAGKAFFDAAAGFVFATRREQEKARERIGNRRAWIVNWPVPPAAAIDRMAARTSIRTRLGIAPEERMLLFMGRLHSGKRVLETVGTFSGSGARRTHLVLVGPGDEYSTNDVEAFAHAHAALKTHVAGPAYGDAKWAFYYAADGFVNLSAHENFGFTVTEAMAAGLPVILSPGNDLIGEMPTRDCGWLLDDDSGACAAAAIRAFDMAPFERLHEMGERGRSWAAANVGVEPFRARLLAVMREAVEDRGAAAA